jgi:hypothetical protein
MLLSGYGEGMIVWQNFVGNPLILQRIIFSTGDVRSFPSPTTIGFELVEKVGPFFSYGILENKNENYNLLSCQNSPSTPFLRLGLTYTSTFTTITGIGGTCSMLSLSLSSMYSLLDQLYFMSEDVSVGLQEVKLALVACDLTLPSNKTNNYFFLESFTPSSCQITETYNHILEDPKIFASNTSLFVLGRYNLLILDSNLDPITPALSLSSIAVVTDYSTGNSYCFGPLAGVCSAILPTTFNYITQLDGVTGQPIEVSTQLSQPIPVQELAVGSEYNIIGSGSEVAYIWLNGPSYIYTFSTGDVTISSASFFALSTLVNIFSSCPGIFFMNGILHTNGVLKILLPLASNGDVVAWVLSTGIVEVPFSFGLAALPGVCGFGLSPAGDAWTFRLSGQSSVLSNAPQYPTLVYCSASTIMVPDFQVMSLSLTIASCAQLSTRLSTGPYSLFTPWVASGTVFAYGPTGLGRYQATIPGSIVPLTGDVLGVAYMVTDFSTNKHYVFRNASGDYIQVSGSSVAAAIVEIDPVNRLALGGFLLTTPFTITGDCSSSIGELVVLSGYGEVGFLIGESHNFLSPSFPIILCLTRSLSIPKGSTLYTIDPTSGLVVMTLTAALPSITCCGNTPPSGILETLGAVR